MGSFKVIIVPSSEDGEAFENAVEFEEAQRVLESLNDTSAQELEFETEKEAEAYIQGYLAGIGFMGDGVFYRDYEEE
jgi:hypothetical protein